MRWTRPGIGTPIRAGLTGRGGLRDELVETLLSRLVLARAATQAGEYAEARRHLLSALTNADRASRDIWAAAAMEALADLDVAEYGRHPAVDLWKRMAREALRGQGRLRLTGLV